MASEFLAKRTLMDASLPVQPKGPNPKHIFEGHEETVSNFIFLHDNVHIVSGSLDCTMHKWDCNTGFLVGEPWKDENQYIDALSLSPDGKAIACGREDGSIQHWNLEGEIKGVWTGHSDWVRSLSWSPSGDHLASGSNDGIILIRQAESGDIEVGPIETKQGRVFTLAYSPSGDRVASGGDSTICIWEAKTGLLVVGPIEELGAYVTSVVWSSDNSQLYAASDKFARVFDSTSGAQLHHFEHLHPVNSVALSPKANVLACVGNHGIAQLWNTESHQPLGLPFGQEDHETLHCVSFSPDGRYLAYCGNDMKITLWVAKHIAPELASPSPSCLDVNDITEEGRDDPYDGDNFFRSSRPLGPSSGLPRSSQHIRLSSARRFWNIFIPSRPRPPVNQPIPLHQRRKRSFFVRHTGPTPVTVSAAKAKNRIYVARPPPSQKKNADTNSPAGQKSSAEQPHSASDMLQHTQTQSETRPAKEDYGCWVNFCLALGIHHRTVVVSAATS